MKNMEVIREYWKQSTDRTEATAQYSKMHLIKCSTQRLRKTSMT